MYKFIPKFIDIFSRVNMIMSSFNVSYIPAYPIYPVSDMYNQIYGNLSSVMSRPYANNQPMQLSATSRAKLEGYLKRVKDLEAEINNFYTNNALRDEINRNSYGAIDAYSVPDAQLPLLLQKHADLLDKTTQYNSASAKVGKLLQQIADALGQSVQATGSVYVPMNSDLWN
jgi:hypothetical protein